MRRGLFVLLFVVLAAGAGAEDNHFQKYNPDVDKYSFAKSYIMGLSYYHRVALRLAKEDRSNIRSKSDDEALKLMIDHRTEDNAELRIARNYLTRYAASSNGLIRKLAIDTANVYDRLLAISVKERELWKGFAAYRAGEIAEYDEDDFKRQIILLTREKKEVAKDLARYSVLLSQVVLRSESCPEKDCYNLALTAGERDKLVRNLDSFARDMTGWGLKPGQSTVEASVATLREVLEDSLYVSKE